MSTKHSEALESGSDLEVAYQLRLFDDIHDVCTINVIYVQAQTVS